MFEGGDLATEIHQNDSDLKIFIDQSEDPLKINPNGFQQDFYWTTSWSIGVGWPWSLTI